MVLSGCVQQDITDLAKLNPQISEFLQSYPNATIVASFIAKEKIKPIIEEIRKECEASLDVLDYYKVKIFDPDTNFTLTAWIRDSDRKIICLIKSGQVSSDAQIQDKNSQQKTALSNCSENSGPDCNVTAESSRKEFIPEIPSQFPQDKITYYANNGICEKEEYGGPISDCSGNSTATGGIDDLNNFDCPKSCNDSNPNTADSYDFNNQICVHSCCGQAKNCLPVCEQLTPTGTPIFAGAAWSGNKIKPGEILIAKLSFRKEDESAGQIPHATNKLVPNLLPIDQLKDKVKIRFEFYGLCNEKFLNEKGDTILEKPTICGQEGFPNSEGVYETSCVLTEPNGCQSDSAGVSIVYNRIDCYDPDADGSPGGKGYSGIGVIRQLPTIFEASDGKVKYSVKTLVDPKFSGIQQGWRWLELEFEIENIDSNEDTYWRPNSYVQVFTSDDKQIITGFNCHGACNSLRKGEKGLVALGFNVRVELGVSKIVFNMPTKSETFSNIQIVEDPTWKQP